MEQTVTQQHTPGPWHLDDNVLGAERIVADNGYSIATVYLKGAAPGLERPANARLIAAAPDLLAALEEALEHIERTCRTAHRILSTDDCQSCALPAFDARAAIRKATGEDGRLIVDASDMGSGIDDDEEREANARLIAARVALLAALIRCEQEARDEGREWFWPLPSARPPARTS